MVRIELPPVPLPVPADRLFSFLADLSRHRAFLEPDAAEFSGDADSHRYTLDVMGMKMGLEMRILERNAPTQVVLTAGGRKLFDQTLRFDIQPGPGTGCTLTVTVAADIPMMMTMMGAEKILRGQLEKSLARIEDLARNGAL